MLDVKILSFESERIGLSVKFGEKNKNFRDILIDSRVTFIITQIFLISHSKLIYKI